MPEPDEMQVRDALERLRDRSASDVDVEARLDELHARTAGGGAARRWGMGLLAVAAVVALVAGSVAVLRDGDDRIVTGPADEDRAPETADLTHDQDAKHTLERAVQATLDAPGWVAKLSGGIGRTTVRFQGPNRVHSFTSDGDRNPVATQIVIGTDSWSTDSSGGGVRDQRDWRTVAPFTLLDALRSACAVDLDGELLAWDGSDGCALPADQALEGTDVWLVVVDDDGRLARIDTGELQPGPVDPDLPRAGLNRLAGLPVGAQLNITFRYDDVPEVNAPDAVADTATPNEAQVLLTKAYEVLGGQHRGSPSPTCCLWSPGSSVAHVAWFKERLALPIVGTPVDVRTYDHDGAPAVFVLDNDVVVDAGPVDLSGTPGIVGSADGYPFAAFTCGGYLWTVGGLFEEVGAPLDRDEVHAAAVDLAGAFSCEPGDRPVAPGHGDPHD